MSLRAEAVLFDKDGTLFDFHATWSVWALDAMRTLSGGVADRLEAMADSARFDLVAGRFLPDSPIIAGTNREAAACLARVLPDRSVEEVEHFLMVSAAEAPLAEAVPLAPLLARLGQMGLVLGVMTNDTEYAARAHLETAGITQAFDFVAGFDSGHGAEARPGAASGLRPQHWPGSGTLRHGGRQHA
ncbi:HAD-superfamily hydrolase, subfamily IA, variant 1 family protein [Salipiger mucosus DSM 16094]|uniref:HAD-superfamily hydrolase, subfamily IA, variant 1 family protein n=1 Tax=Salipiger mucosus DSM 16094 TaxID=1123237 RepID=S9R0H9_9RHOB|nr:HAD-superfamily hydrolase, subfamily IA, variant 1 family protein [Salipiger mucosus DSM 16094]